MENQQTDGLLHQKLVQDELVFLRRGTLKRKKLASPEVFSTSAVRPVVVPDSPAGSDSLVSPNEQRRKVAKCDSLCFPGSVMLADTADTTVIENVQESAPSYIIEQLEPEYYSGTISPPSPSVFLPTEDETSVLISFEKEIADAARESPWPGAEPLESVYIKGTLPLTSAPFITLDSERDNIAYFSSHEQFVEESLQELRASVPFPNAEAFVNDLKTAVERCQDGEEHPYTKVQALLLSWEDDDLNVEGEVTQLHKVLSNTYRYNVQRWRIPTTCTKKDRKRKFKKRIQDFVQTDDDETLHIVYYAGHGNQQFWGPCEWTSSRSLGVSLAPSILLAELEDLDGDVLLLLDCCHAWPSTVQSGGSGVIVAITATGFGSDAIAAEPGPDSFTNALIKVLSAFSWRTRPFFDSELYSEIIHQLQDEKSGPKLKENGDYDLDFCSRPIFETPKRRNPVMRTLSQLPAGKLPRHVRLAPLPLVDSPSPDSVQKPATKETTGGMDVLVRIKFACDSDFKAIAQSLSDIPDFLRIKVVGAWQSTSIMWLVRMPMLVWETIPKHRGLMSIGLISGDDLAPALNNKLYSELHGYGMMSEKFEVHKHSSPESTTGSSLADISLHDVQPDPWDEFAEFLSFHDVGDGIVEPGVLVRPSVAIFSCDDAENSLHSRCIKQHKSPLGSGSHKGVVPCESSRDNTRDHHSEQPITERPNKAAIFWYCFYCNDGGLPRSLDYCPNCQIWKDPRSKTEDHCTPAY